MEDVPESVFRVHRRLSSFEGWLHKIPRLMFGDGNVALVVGGSTDIHDARRIMGKRHPGLHIEILHAHLHDDVSVKRLEEGRCCLIATEALYRRPKLCRLVSWVYDDCQVHRITVLGFQALGKARCLRTYMANAQEMERRHKLAEEFDYAYSPRIKSQRAAPSNEQFDCKEAEPRDLAEAAIAAAKHVTHPLLGFSLAVPKLRYTRGVSGKPAIVYESGRSSELSINELPLANLLQGAAEEADLSGAQRAGLLALVAASQVTANAPTLFGDPARASFNNAETMGVDVNIAVLLRAFLSDCGRSADEIGLACLYLETGGVDLDDRAGMHAKMLVNTRGAPLSAYFADPVLAVDVLVPLLVAMHDGFLSSLEQLRRHLRHEQRDDHIMDSALRSSQTGISRSGAARCANFLHERFMSAAASGQTACGGFVLSLALRVSAVSTPLHPPRLFLGPTGAEDADIHSEALAVALGVPPRRRDKGWDLKSDQGWAEGSELGVCAAEVAQQEQEFAWQQNRSVRGEAAHESRAPYYYELAPLGIGDSELHLRLTARPLWTFVAAATPAFRRLVSASGDDYTTQIPGVGQCLMRVVGTVAYLRRRLILDREDVCLIESTLFSATLPTQTAPAPDPASQLSLVHPPLELDTLPPLRHSAPHKLYGAHTQGKQTRKSDAVSSHKGGKWAKKRKR